MKLIDDLIIDYEQHMSKSQPNMIIPTETIGKLLSLITALNITLKSASDAIKIVTDALEYTKDK